MARWFLDSDRELAGYQTDLNAKQGAAGRTGTFFDKWSGAFKPQQDNSQVVADLSRYQDLYHWLAPATMMTLVRNGIKADSPDGAQIAMTAAKVEADRGTAFTQPQPVAAAQAKNLRGPFSDVFDAIDQAHANEDKYITQPQSPAESLYGPRLNLPGLGMGKTAWDKLPLDVRNELSQLQFNPVDTSTASTFQGGAPAQQVYELPGIDQLSPAAKAALTQQVTDPNSGFYVHGPAFGTQERGANGFAPVTGSNYLVFTGKGRDTSPSGGQYGNVIGVRPMNPTAAGVQDLSQVVNPLARAANMAMAAPLQELQGQTGNLFQAFHGTTPNFLESQSDLGVSIDDIIHGRPADSGQGLFVDPSSPVAQERRTRQLERGNIGGHTITPGRWAADTFFEPDTIPFDALSGAVDLGIALKGDPTYLALQKFSKVKAGASLFQEAGSLGRATQVLRDTHSVPDALEEFAKAGGVMGIRKTTSPAAAAKWWDSEDGTAVANWTAQHMKSRDIIDGFKGKLPAQVVGPLADETDPEVVRATLKELSMSGQMIEKPNPFGLLSPIKGALDVTPQAQLGAMRSKQSVRLFGTLPGAAVDLDAPMENVHQVQNWLANQKAPQAVIDDFVDRMVRAPDRGARKEVWFDAVGSTKGVLVNKYGVDADVAEELTRMVRNTDRSMQKYDIDYYGNPVNPWKHEVQVGERMVAVPTPELLDEHIGKILTLPDARAIRRITSKLSPMVKVGDNTIPLGLATANGKQRLPLAVLQGAQDEIWKPLALLRGAWTLRVIGEEQIRMAASGLESVVHHPLSALAWVTGAKGETGILDNALNGVDEYAKAMSKGSGGFLHRAGSVLTGQYTVASKRPEELGDYMRGWAGELAQLHADPVARKVAQYDNLEDAQKWFWNNAEERQLLINQGHPSLDLPGPANDYIESLANRISTKTGDHADLLDAVKTGKLNDVPLISMTEGRTHPQFVKELKGYIDSGPMGVKVERTLQMRGEAVKSRLDGVVETLFGALMSRPTNYLSRSPTFRQAYWDHQLKLLPYMAPEAQAKAISAAEKAGLDGSVLQRILHPLEGNIVDKMRQVRSAPGAFGTLSAEGADYIARGAALDYTRNLLYDLSERSQLFDTLRLVMPFGEAWKEVITRWARLGYERPQNIRRAQQLVEGARSPQFGQLLGAGTRIVPGPLGADGLPTDGVPVANGFFHPNDQGEEVFTYPGSQWLTGQMIGVPVPLTGRVSGLNMVGNVLPALGPVAQIPAAWFIPDDPKWDEVRNTLFPYGQPGDPFTTKTWLPPWANRILNYGKGKLGIQTDPDQIRMDANATMDVARYLASTGDYDLNTPEGQSKLMEDAKSKAAQFALIRGSVQFFAPSAPSPDWLVKDKNGHLLEASALIQDFQNMQQRNYDTAAQDFLNKYGTEPFLIMQSKTHSVSFGYPTNEDGLKWMRQNPDIQSKFPNVFGYFAPQGGKFSYQAYLRAIQTGAKQPLTLDQFVKLGSAQLAEIQYQQAKKAVGNSPSDAQRAGLRTLKEALYREYPGYQESDESRLGLVERATPQGKVDELTKAVKDPRLAATDAGQAAIQYLDARKVASEKGVKSGLSPDGFQNAKKMVATRDALRAVGEALVKEHPGFGALWEQVFSRELADDTDTTGPGAG